MRQHGCRRCATRTEPRHVDLRPFILSGATSYVSAGASPAPAQGLVDRQLVQGGGSKDTWIVEA